MVRPHVQWEGVIVTIILTADLGWCVAQTTAGTFIRMLMVKLIVALPKVKYELLHPHNLPVVMCRYEPTRHWLQYQAPSIYRNNLTGIVSVKTVPSLVVWVQHKTHFFCPFFPTSLDMSYDAQKPLSVG